MTQTHEGARSGRRDLAEMPGRDPQRTVYVFVALVVLAGAASLVLTMGATWRSGVGDVRLLALSIVGLAVVNAYRITFRWKGEAEQVTIDETFFVILVVASPPAAAVIALLFGNLFGSVRFRLPLIKVVFNLGACALSVSAALWVTRLVAGDVPSGYAWAGIAGVALGAVTMHTVQTLAVHTVVALAARLPFTRLFARFSLFEVVILTSAVSMGLLAGFAARTHVLLLALAFPPLAVIYFVLHQHSRVVHSRSELDLLLETAVKASRTVSVQGTCDVLVDAACTLLHTADARIQLHPPLDDEIGSLIHADTSVLWLVARTRAGTRSVNREEQSLLDGIAAIGSGAVGSAELLDRVRNHAFHDSLTGLPNRLLFEDRVNQALRGHGTRSAGVLFIDLDRFNRVNDSLGHRAGDLLLQQFAERLQLELRGGDSSARLSGDEFAVLLPELASDQEATDAASRLHSMMREPFMLEGRQVIVTASVGVAVSPVDGADFESLIRSADLAMHDAKAGGRDAVRRAFVRRGLGGGLALEAELRHAIAQNELWVAYQPQIDLADMRIVGAEALVRWAHPTRGLMRPGEFLPLAEELGLLGAIDEWVLAEACRQTAAWRAASSRDLRVSVNFSRGPLRSSAVHDLVRATLRRTGLPAAALEIEVTEKVVTMDDDTIFESLAKLRALGVRVAMDDFGTGYSSLSRLRTLPVDVVKIDQSFVREIVDAEISVPLVSGTIDMAHGLGLQVVAEGVETPEQLKFLAEGGCEIAQGYLLGRPMRAEQMGNLIALSREPDGDADSGIGRPAVRG